MTQSTAIDHDLKTSDGRPVAVEGEAGKEDLRVRSDRQTALLESIDSNLKRLLTLIEANL